MAEGNYAKVRTGFWTDPDVRIDLGPEEKLLLLYWFTSVHGNMVGLYYCPLEYAAKETGLELDRVRDLTLGPLARFVTYDLRTEEVLVHRAARHQIGEELKAGDKRRNAVVREVASAQSGTLVDRLHELYPGWDFGVENAPESPPPPPSPEGAPEGAPPEKPKPHPKGHTMGPVQLSTAKSSQAKSCISVSSSGSIEPGAGAAVENSRKDRNGRSPSFGALLQVAREVGMKGDPRDDGRNGSVLKQLLRHRSPDDVESAIRGFRLLTDRGQTFVDRGDRFGLRALNHTMTLADQGDGRAVRPAFDVAQEAWLREDEPGRAPPGEGPTRLEVRIA